MDLDENPGSRPDRLRGDVPHADRPDPLTLSLSPLGRGLGEGYHSSAGDLPYPVFILENRAAGPGNPRSFHLKAGQPMGIQPAGLGARDTLRLEAGLPLGGSDLDEKTTPLEANLDWTIEWRKGPFMGREALERQKREGVTRRLAGFEMKGPGIPRPGCPIFQDENRMGQVTSGTMLAGNRAIGMGVVSPQAARPGTRILIEIYNRKVEAEIVKLPFYRRKK